MNRFTKKQITKIRKLSTTDVSHMHYVEVRATTPHHMLSTNNQIHHTLQVSYDETRGLGKEFDLTWCTTVTTQSSESCPSSVASDPTKCGKTNSGFDCCYGKCPDNHPNVELVV